jgi:hypothetical protein
VLGCAVLYASAGCRLTGTQAVCGLPPSPDYLLQRQHCSQIFIVVCCAELWFADCCLASPELVYGRPHTPAVIAHRLMPVINLCNRFVCAFSAVLQCAMLSQAVVQQALSRLMAGRTVLVIAHRLSTIRDADRICVISGGQLSEQGSHEELLSTKGIYAVLIARQLAASGSSDGLEGGQPLSLGSFGSSRGAGGSLSDLSDGARASLQEVSGRGSMSSSRSSACRDRSSTEAAADNAAAAASAAAAAAAGEASRSQQQQ